MKAKPFLHCRHSSVLCFITAKRLCAVEASLLLIPWQALAVWQLSEVIWMNLYASRMLQCEWVHIMESQTTTSKIRVHPPTRTCRFCRYSSSHKKNSAAIKRRHTHRVEARTVPSTNDGAPCTSVDKVLERWNEHYQQMLNHAPATKCPDLNDAATNAAPAVDVQYVRRGRTNSGGGPEGDQKTSKRLSRRSRQDHHGASKNCRDTDQHGSLPTIFCSYGSRERFLQTGKRPWSYHYTRWKVQEPYLQ